MKKRKSVLLYPRLTMEKSHLMGIIQRGIPQLPIAIEGNSNQLWNTAISILFTFQTINMISKR
jgi:uncharacterized protein YabE (DUF348 family)